MTPPLDIPVAHVPQIVQLCPSAVDALSNEIVILSFVGVIALLVTTLRLLGKLGAWLEGTAPCKWLIGQSDTTLQEELRENRAKVAWLEERVGYLQGKAGTTQREQSIEGEIL